MTSNTTTGAHTRPAISEHEYNAARDFLYLEARLADESRYLDWEALVEDDMISWVPRGEGDFDIDKHVSITADNRSRLRTRIAQLATGKRHAQVPVSTMRRMVSNIEVARLPDGGWQVFSNFVLYELRRSSTGKVEARITRRVGIRMACGGSCSPANRRRSRSTAALTVASIACWTVVK